MKSFVLLLVVNILFLVGGAQATLISSIGGLSRDSITYKLSGPSPFQQVEVEFRIEGFHSLLKIKEIVISVNGTSYLIDAKQLDIDYHPKLDDLYFVYDIRDEKAGALEAVWFRIPFDRKEFLDCGVDGRVGFYKMKKIVINAFDSPDVIDIKRHITDCDKKENQRYPIEKLFE